MDRGAPRCQGKGREPHTADLLLEPYPPFLGPHRHARVRAPLMKAILGISAYYHDSAAALVVDGRVVAAAQEERFTRVKHDHRFPEAAVHFCLGKVGLRAEDIDHVVFYEKPFLKFERIL